QKRRYQHALTVEGVLSSGVSDFQAALYDLSVLFKVAEERGIVLCIIFGKNCFKYIITYAIGTQSVGIDGGKILGGAFSSKYLAVFSRFSFPYFQCNPKIFDRLNDGSDLDISQLVLPECLRQLITGSN